MRHSQKTKLLPAPDKGFAIWFFNILYFGAPIIVAFVGGLTGIAVMGLPAPCFAWSRGSLNPQFVTQLAARSIFLGFTAIFVFLRAVREAADN